jgi:phenylacetate-coenzyme A ligase PaaK-like adenylate-forming protein
MATVGHDGSHVNEDHFPAGSPGRRPGPPVDAATDHAELAVRLRAAMREALGTDVVIVVEAPGTEPRTPGKAVRVVDGR